MEGSLWVWRWLVYKKKEKIETRRKQSQKSIHTIKLSFSCHHQFILTIWTLACHSFAFTGGKRAPLKSEQYRCYHKAHKTAPRIKKKKFCSPLAAPNSDYRLGIVTQVQLTGTQQLTQQLSVMHSSLSIAGLEILQGQVCGSLLIQTRCKASHTLVVLHKALTRLILQIHTLLRIMSGYILLPLFLRSQRSTILTTFPLSVK